MNKAFLLAALVSLRALAQDAGLDAVAAPAALVDAPDAGAANTTDSSDAGAPQQDVDGGARDADAARLAQGDVDAGVPTKKDKKPFTGVSGRVIDARTGEGLIEATVKVVSPTFNCTSSRKPGGRASGGIHKSSRYARVVWPGIEAPGSGMAPKCGRCVIGSSASTESVCPCTMWRASRTASVTTSWRATPPCRMGVAPAWARASLGSMRRAFW